MRPLPHRERLILALLACYIFATSSVGWYRLYHTSLSRRRFQDVIFSPSSLVGRKEIQLFQECLPAALTSCTHVLAIYQRKWEINSLLYQITGQKWVLFFCFVWLLLFVYQSLDRLYSVQFPAFCLRFVFLPFALRACFLLFPCVAQVSLFPALFT